MNTMQPNENTQVYQLWQDILDIVGPVSRWPTEIRRFFWTRNWGYDERFQVAVFAYVNGLNPVIVCHWARLMGSISNGKGWRHLTNLFIMFEEGVHYRQEYWAVNVHNNRQEYLDGTTRYYRPRSRY